MRISGVIQRKVKFSNIIKIKHSKVDTGIERSTVRTDNYPKWQIIIIIRIRARTRVEDPQVKRKGDFTQEKILHARRVELGFRKSAILVPARRIQNNLI